MQPVVLADAEDGDDVGVAQPSGGPRLAAKPQHFLFGEQRVPGKHLDRHVPIERLLVRLVDDAHPAAANLADDLEVAQVRRWLRQTAATDRGTATGFLLPAKLLDHRHGGKKLLDLPGELRMPGSILRDRRSLAAAQPRGKFVRQFFHRIALWCRVDHGSKSCQQSAVSGQP